MDWEGIIVGGAKADPPRDEEATHTGRFSACSMSALSALRGSPDCCHGGRLPLPRAKFVTRPRRLARLGTVAETSWRRSPLSSLLPMGVHGPVSAPDAYHRVTRDRNGAMSGQSCGWSCPTLMLRCLR